MSVIREQAREIAVAAEYDVVVCGAGPAGVAAALGAARAGARTLLLEVNGCLGGVWTAGLLCWIIDAAGKPGIMGEISARLDTAGGRRFRVPNGRNYAYDPEYMKWLLEDLCREAGVDVALHTRAVSAYCVDNRLDAVITESKSGREAWRGRAFVDASGDGDLGALCGCAFEVGHPETGRCQPMSMTCLLTGIHFSEVEAFTGGSMGDPKQRLLREIQAAGVEPSYQPPAMMAIRDDLFVLIPHHQYGAAASSARDVTRGTLEGRREIQEIVKALRAKGGVWKNLRVVATAEHIGVREGRRIAGRYTVTLDDMINGVCHADAVCRVNFGIDVHSTDSRKARGFERPEGVRVQAYDIPFRSLVARDIEGLLVAGRCISGDFLAHSSYRVTGNAVPMGEAAGVAAALSARRNEPPAALPWDVVATEIARTREQ